MQNLKNYEKELQDNGYNVFKGAKLKEIKTILSGRGIDTLTKTTVLGLFNFRAFLDLCMIIKDSERAQYIIIKTIFTVVESKKAVK